MNCDELATKYGITPEAVQEIRKEINDGVPIEEVFKTRKTRIQKAYDKNPETYKRVKDIQKKIDEGDLSAAKVIEYHLVPEAGKGNPLSNLESRKASIRDAGLYKHHDLLNSLRNKLFGNKPAKNLLANMLRQQFGEINDPAAKIALKEFNDINNHFQDGYVKSGGTQPNIGFGLHNNQERILQDDFDTFYMNTKDLVHNTQTELKALYQKAHLGDDISIDILDFNNSEDYLKYAGLYGTDMWSSFMNQINKRATQTAGNQIFGPNTNAAINKLIKDNKLNASETERIWSLTSALNGDINIPINATLSKYAKGSRSIVTAAMLAGATLSAVSDLASILVTASFNNMPAIKTMFSALGGLFKLEENKRLLSQLGIITDDLIDGLRNSNRFDQNEAGTDMFSTVVDKVLRGSGLMAWTTGVKNAWKLSHLAQMSNITKQYKTIPKSMKEQMKRYGITQKDWSTIRQQDGEFMDVTKFDETLAHKMRRFIKEESDYAVLEPGASNQAYMALGTKAGTVKGEVVRSTTQFKSFLVAGVLTHLSRVLKLDTNLDKATYTMKLLTAGTTIGMLVLGLKDISKGNDPTTRDYTDPKNYLAAMEASGIAGPLGEFFKPSQFGSSPLDLFSPAGAPVLSLLKPLIEAKGFATDEKLSKTFGDMAKQVGMLVPGRSSWYAKWAIQEFGRNTLLMVNPDYQSSFDRIDRATAKRESKSGLEEMDIDFF